jgi:hypothetical protein
MSLDIGYRFTNLFRASFGYDFLFWSSVARPGDQVTSLGKTTDNTQRELTRGTRGCVEAAAGAEQSQLESSTSGRQVKSPMGRGKVLHASATNTHNSR